MGSVFSATPTKNLQYIDLGQLADEICNYNYIVALTGAGISVGSGLPTFRDPSDGIWLRFDPNACGTIWGFWKSPEKIWQLLCTVLREIDPKPNSGHKALAMLEEKGYLKSIITQNIDNLHQDAGSTNVIEYHGNVTKAMCSSCRESIILTRSILKDHNFIKNLPPKCSCGKILKPNVVLFGERIPGNIARMANEEAKRCDMLLIIGTSASVYPASGLIYSASRNGAKIVEINLEETAITHKITDFFLKSSSNDLFSLACTIPYKIQPSESCKLNL